MKFLKQGLSLALLGAGLAAVPAMQASAVGQAPAASGDSLVQRIRNDAKGAVEFSKERATGKVGFVRTSGNGDLMPSLEGDSATAAAAKSAAYLKKYAAAFGTTAGQLSQDRTDADKYGWTVTFVQEYDGVKVFGSALKVHVDKAGDLTSVNGYTAPGLNLDTTPRLSAAEAASRAVSAVLANPPGAANGANTRTSGLKAKNNELVIYRLGSVRGEQGKAVLTYVVEVTNDKNIRDSVFVDAGTGKLVNRYSMIDNALDRDLYEGSLDDNGTPDDPDDDSPVYDLVWSEGDVFPGTLDEDQQSEVAGTGEAYWFFQNAFGRDSYDDAGSKMITVNNDPTIACPNANWNGQTTNYCSGVSSDDTVAHEWAHAYTEYTSGLIYQWQSGAMNEAYSDIWGESVDMLNDRQNETPDTARTVGLCSAYTRSEVGVRINTPVGIAKECVAAPASFGPVIDETGITGDVVIAADAVEEGGTGTDGCSPFTNAAAVAGNIVMVDRGLCAFGDKAENAEDAGATAVIIGNRDEAPFSAAGGLNPISVPTAMIGLSDRELIRTAILNAETVNITLRDIDEAEKDDSYRWLSGESDVAFGGAIRDMWNPNCFGDPGKVSDAEYICSTDDAGGVHSNSGVVNHTYSLLVDGGTYNGVTVPGIGLDKAANLFWRTQTAYLTPISDFQDLADGLASSCTDLLGQDINTMTVEPNATPVLADDITAADCTAVDLVSQATELDVEPVQCDFQPMLEQGAPSLCGKGFRTKAAFTEDFDKGLKGWTASKEIVFAGGFNDPWTATVNAPGNHAGRVAYGPAPDEGQCVNGAGDFSSRDSITSPVIEFPAGKSPRLSFEHYVATELGYDGANVKVSINGRKFKVIPAAAYIFNAPAETIVSDVEGNTNPLAGEEGFTGTDGGEVTGTWGKSYVNLKKIGAVPGQRLKFRFDVGRDGCGGNDGWYVDNVKVVVCKAVTKTIANPVAGTRAKVIVKVKRDGSEGNPPAGLVKVFKKGKAIASGKVSNGRVTLKLPRSLKVGEHRVTVIYLGNTAFTRSSDTVVVRVTRR